MVERKDINCNDCGKFILTEERKGFCEDIKCVSGNYKNGYYEVKEDVFYCRECAIKRGFIKENSNEIKVSMITYKDYDEETAREVVMDWFQEQGKEYYTSDDVADILDDFENSIDEIRSEDGMEELETYLKLRREKYEITKVYTK